MTETNVQEQAVNTESPVAPREVWTYCEAIMIGSSERNPVNGELYIMKRMAEENFPDWVFTCPEVEKSSLEEVNRRRKGTAIYSDMIGPLSFSDLPADCTFELFLGDIEPGLPKYEFGIAKELWEEDILLRRLEIKKPAVVKLIRIEEADKQYWRLEPVPNHPDRRYLVSVRKVV